MGSNLTSGTYTTVYVNNADMQTWVLNCSKYGPSAWSTSNVIVKTV